MQRGRDSKDHWIRVLRVVYAVRCSRVEHPRYLARRGVPLERLCVLKGIVGGIPEVETPHRGTAEPGRREVVLLGILCPLGHIVVVPWVGHVRVRLDDAHLVPRLVVRCEPGISTGPLAALSEAPKAVAAVTCEEAGGDLIHRAVPFCG